MKFPTIKEVIDYCVYVHLLSRAMKNPLKPGVLEKLDAHIKKTTKN